MGTEVIQGKEVVLDDVRYPLTNDVTEVSASVFPQKLVTGDYTKDSDLFHSTWSIADQRGGLLIEEMDEEKDANRYWWSDCITEYKGNIALPRLATSITSVAVDDEGYCVVLRPIGAGAETAMDTLVGAATAWQAVDEVQKDDDTTYIADDGTARDLFILPRADMGTDVITSVTVCCYAKSAGANDNIQLSLRTNATTYDSADKALTASYALLTNTWTTNPNTSAAWTWASINTLEAGVESQSTGSADKVICTQVFVIVECSASARWRRTIFIDYHGDLYVARGGVLCALLSTGDEIATSKSDFTYNITSMVAIGRYLYIFEGDASGYWYFDGVSTFTQADVGGDLAIYWDGKLWWLDHFGNFYSATTPNSTDPTVTTQGVLPISPGEAQALYIDKNAAGDDVIYCSTKTGPWAYDDTSSTWLKTSLEYPTSPNGGKGVCVRRDSAYISSGQDVFKYDAVNASIDTVGLNRNDGLPQEYDGEIVKLYAGFNEVFALIDSSEATGTSTSTLMTYNDDGWRTWWVGDSTEKGMSDCIISSDYAYRFWFDHNDTVYYFPLTRGLRNPLKYTTTTYAAAGTHVTPWFDANWEVGQKLALSLDVSTVNPTTSETVIVKYRIDHATTALAATWTTLGTITTTGLTTYTFGSSLGINFKAIQFRFDLARGATTTNTPKVRYATLKYRKVLPKKWGWRFQVDCSQAYPKDGPTAKGPALLISSLKTSAEKTTLVSFVYDNVTKYVFIESVEGARATGRDRRGLYNVYVTEG